MKQPLYQLIESTDFGWLQKCTVFGHKGSEAAIFVEGSNHVVTFRRKPKYDDCVENGKKLEQPILSGGNRNDF